MLIGVYLQPDWKPTEGGGFSYFDKLILSMDNHQFHNDIEICFFSDREIKIEKLNHKIIALTHKSRLKFVKHVFSKLPCIGSRLNLIFERRENRRRQKSFREQLHKNNVDLLYYPVQNTCIIEDFPFICNNWDIGHCSTYAFPELIMNGNFEWRSNFYENVLPKALMVFTESETGKKELLEFTTLNSERIKVLPIFAGDCINENVSNKKQIDILKKYNLSKNKYFFYPAQFWAHKNHSTLLYAFQLFYKSHPDYKLVLTGSDKGNFNYIKQLCYKLSIEQNVIFPGFVANDTINTFYKNATALTFVSFFGPTNMPPLEALHLGCPIICTDLGGHREELNEAAIYINPLSSESIYQAMITMINERESYIKKGGKQLMLTPFKIKETIQRMDSHFQVIEIIRNTWGEA